VLVGGYEKPMATKAIYAPATQELTRLANHLLSGLHSCTVASFAVFFKKAANN
jgi:Ni,Fe-hydrogenase III large subunit